MYDNLLILSKYLSFIYEEILRQYISCTPKKQMKGNEKNTIFIINCFMLFQ